MTQHVNHSLTEADRLYEARASSLADNERPWIDGVVKDTRDALLDVAKLIEPARVDTVSMQSINFKNRVLWVFRDSPKVRDKYNRLSICYQSLTSVISSLKIKDAFVFPCDQADNDEQPPAYDRKMEAWLNYRNSLKRYRSSISQISQSEISTPLRPELPSSWSDPIVPHPQSPKLEISVSSSASLLDEVMSATSTLQSWEE